MYEGGLHNWQFTHYPANHRARRNLVIHVLTVPLFALGVAAIPLGLVTLRPLVALGGLVAMVVAVAAQGRGHAGETVPPQPFRGPWDVVSRIVTEQLVTFPRFVLSGGFARAWREAR